MCAKKHLAIFSIVLSLAYFAILELSMEPAMSQNARNDFRGGSLHELEQQVMSLQQERLEIIDNLIRGLRKEADTEKKIRLCFLLGEYRASEAVPDLARTIVLESDVDPTKEIKRLPLWGKYPAQEALVKIGVPSISAMLKLLQTSDDDTVIKLAATVIRDVYGPEIGKYVLQRAAEKESDSKKKAPLTDAIRLLK